MKLFHAITLSLAAIFICTAASCDEGPETAIASTGVQRAVAHIQTQASGLTIEQENIKRRLEEDNKPGSIKHLYVLSAMTGDVIMYSTVKGKVTSSGKRLTPLSVSAGCANGEGCYGVRVNIAGDRNMTGEVMQDDGTYGSSAEYVYWWDSKGTYRQLYITGGMMVVVSNVPIRVRKTALNLEQE